MATTGAKTTADMSDVLDIGIAAGIAGMLLTLTRHKLIKTDPAAERLND
jgi:hypothetical protein